MSHVSSPSPASSNARSAGFSPSVLVGLAIAVLALWFGTLGARHLLPSDEGRYAEIAREMVASGDWVTIRYNGLKYFEKPPFHLWMTALAFEAFGIGEWQARLWSGLSGAFGIGITALAARRWYGAGAGWLAGWVLLAAPAWNLGSHFNALDIGVSAALAGVLAGVLLAQHPGAEVATRRRWMLFAWGAMAVATLTKGLIGIALPGMVLIVYTAVARDVGIWRRLHLLAGLVLFLAITAPWFVLVSLRNPEFPHFFFVHEHWERYTSTVHHRSAPFWYFVPQLLAGFLPWLGLAARLPRVVRGEAAGPNGFRPKRLLACWAVTIFVFFSLSGSKLPGYILPVYPALAVLLALALQSLDRAAWRRQLLWLIGLSVAGLCATPLLLRLGSAAIPNEVYRDYAMWLAGLFVAALAGAVIAWRSNTGDRSERPSTAGIVAVALGWFVAATLGIAGHEAFGRLSSGVDLIPAIRRALTPDMPFYSVKRLDHTVPFYLGRETVMVEDPDELDFGTRQEPAKWLPTVGAFERVWRDGPKALAIMDPETFEALQGRGLPLFPVAQDARRVVIANFRPGPP